MDKPDWMGHALEGAVDLFNRSPISENRLEILPREDLPLYAEDGLWTYHGHGFVDDERFARAYRRAVEAGGFDYRIRWRVHTMLWAAQRAARAEGAFVECGTGRGYMASAVCEYLDWGERPFYLYDSFLPTHPDELGEQSQSGEHLPHYASGPEAVSANFSGWPGVQLVVGRIPDTLTPIGPVAFLHVDLNHPTAEEQAVHHFWPLLSDGAVVVFDDYGNQSYKAHEASTDKLARELGFDVLALPTGQGLVLK
jgi:Methyltransferase domain